MSLLSVVSRLHRRSDKPEPTAGLSRRENTRFIVKMALEGKTSFYLPYKWNMDQSRHTREEFNQFLAWLKNANLKVETMSRTTRECPDRLKTLEQSPVLAPNLWCRSDDKDAYKRGFFDCDRCLKIETQSIAVTITEDTDIFPYLE